jgi:hypothetical protein
MPNAEVDIPINCEECRRAWLDDERGWQAHVVDIDEIALYCPQCAEREFGDAGLARASLARVHARDLRSFAVRRSAGSGLPRLRDIPGGQPIASP